MYLGINVSEGLISIGPIETEQTANAVSNIAKEVRNKVNERFHKTP